MRAALIGTGAIAAKHAQAYRNIGFELVACTNTNPEKGRAFAAEYDCEFFADAAALAHDPRIDFLDVCTLPGYRLEAVELAAATGKHVLVEKPLAIDLATAQAMIATAAAGKVRLGVVSQHRFDDAIQYLRQAINDGRLGKLLQADAYVKWFRTPEYYSRPIKGTWRGEGGGVLINQAIHSLDMLLFLAGSVARVSGMWQLGARHDIEAEDVVNALMQYSSGATGIVQAATAFWPGDAERLEFHGTHGSVTITADEFSRWSLCNDTMASPAIGPQKYSGASDPMAISTVPLERHLLDFAGACETGGPMVSSAEDGRRALELVLAIYESCRREEPVRIS